MIEQAIIVVMYGLLIFIISTGTWQFIRSRFLLNVNRPGFSLVPYGFVAVLFGTLMYLDINRIQFETVRSANYILPSIIAAGFGDDGLLIILGLWCLAFSFLFRYLNQR